MHLLFLAWIILAYWIILIYSLSNWTLIQQNKSELQYIPFYQFNPYAINEPSSSLLKFLWKVNTADEMKSINILIVYTNEADKTKKLNLSVLRLIRFVLYSTYIPIP